MQLCCTASLHTLQLLLGCSACWRDAAGRPAVQVQQRYSLLAVSCSTGRPTAQLQQRCSLPALPCSTKPPPVDRPATAAMQLTGAVLQHLKAYGPATAALQLACAMLPHWMTCGPATAGAVLKDRDDPGPEEFSKASKAWASIPCLTHALGRMHGTGAHGHHKGL
eukprot:357704-Chlamydomonas_euryale.AAC.7